MKLRDRESANGAPDVAPAATSVNGRLANERYRLFLASFLMLFVELVLIRWLGANIVYLSFFSNFVLLGSFLGIGIGFLRGGGANWFRWAPLLLALVMLLSAIFPVTIDRTGSGLIFFGSLQPNGFPIWVSLPIVFAAVAATMAAVAQGVVRRSSGSLPSRRIGWTYWEVWRASRRSACSRCSVHNLVWGLVIASCSRSSYGRYSRSLTPSPWASSRSPST